MSPVNDKLSGLFCGTEHDKQKSPRSPALDGKHGQLDLTSLTRGIRLHSMVNAKSSAAATTNNSTDRFIDFFHDLNDKF